MREKRQKVNPQIPSRLRGRGVEVSKTLFYVIGKSYYIKTLRGMRTTVYIITLSSV